MSFITHVTPTSSNIERIGYNADTLTARVAFKRKGGVALWDYAPVSQADYEIILRSESIGAAVNTYLVKGPVTGRKVTEGGGE